ncbi:MAG: tRNA (adenosine(37)-N6)-threonylcarbamoyltransferase complex transferase subunit TsaD [Anaerolineales bacterium]|nr:tRNA (adenosine(37)-N6)-threonylcarbamoyltransferase complex transferase subunit TsaD [Anaerolineales bacterium]
MSAAKSAKPEIRVLGIETSCDDTGAAVVGDGTRILSNVLLSQSELHARYGGVFPEMASRSHVETIEPAIRRALEEAHLSVDELDAVAVTRGPGLAGSLVVGVNAAKGLALAAGLPILGIHHLEAHIYSLWLGRDEEETFPVLCLIVSGGHSDLYLMHGHGDYRRLGGTLDDAAGEAFDKVARLLGLPYPGGPAIEEAAKLGDPESIRFPRAWLEDTWDFSFSGLKTAVLREVRKYQPALAAGVNPPEPGLPIPNLAASFQAAVVDVLAQKAVRAAREFAAKEILVAGGVSANQELRTALQKLAPCPVRTPPLELCTDNAAMVAAAGYFRFQAGQRSALNMDVSPDLELVQN